MPPKASQSVAHLPWIYSLFFLYIEPVATAAGAWAAHFAQDMYMRLTYSSPTAAVLGVTTTESIVLTQLANLYFVFALNEALVLRATNDRRVWRVFLLGLLIADFGHLYSVRLLGWQFYYRFWEWNSIHWGNLGFVYIGAAMRTAFLLGVGLDQERPAKRKR